MYYKLGHLQVQKLLNSYSLWFRLDLDVQVIRCNSIHRNKKQRLLHKQQSIAHYWYEKEVTLLISVIWHLPGIRILIISIQKFKANLRLVWLLACWGNPVSRSHDRSQNRSFYVPDRPVTRVDERVPSSLLWCMNSHMHRVICFGMRKMKIIQTN